MRGRHLAVLGCCILFSVLLPQPAASLGVPVIGWGYSIGNGVYSIVLPGQPSVSQGFGWWFDPPTPGLIISGRLTIQFDPSWTIGGIGWFGEFGANPALPPPPIGTTFVDVSLLQPNANPAMQSASIVVDQTNGMATFNFDWGPNGLAPAEDNLNFAGIYFSNLQALPPNPLTILGSPADVAANGKNALTYMSCRLGPPGSPEFFCGETAIPEPSAGVLFGAGLTFVIGLLWRQRRAPASPPPH